MVDLYLGDNCIQNVHLGRYIVGYIVGNFVLRRRYNRRYISPNEHFEYGYPHANAPFNIYSSKVHHFAPNWNFVSNVKQLHQPITSYVSYDVGAPTVYGRIFTLANNFLRLTFFGQTRFIHSWTTLVHATLRVSDFIDKCNSWLDDVTFEWCHVMVTAVERNNQTRRIITSSPLICKI